MKGQICGYEGKQMHHPHVFDDGSACFGDFMDPIIVAMEDGDYYSMIDIILLFLEQACNDDCAGKYWPSWIDGMEGGSYMDGD